MLVKLNQTHRFQVVTIAGVEINKVDWVEVPDDTEDPRLIIAPAPEAQAPARKEKKK